MKKSPTTKTTFSLFSSPYFKEGLRIRMTTNARDQGNERAANDDDDDHHLRQKWFFVAKKSEYDENKTLRKQLKIRERFVIVLCNEKDGRFLCFDATCYHMGAPLMNADIEDLGGHGSENSSSSSSSSSCVIVCPWHHYKIDVGKDGERVYVDAFTKEAKTVKFRQRTHFTKVMESDDFDGECVVMVKLNEDLNVYESDRYAFKEPLRSAREKAFGKSSSSNNSNRFRSSGDAFKNNSAINGNNKNNDNIRKESLLSEMVGKSMSGADGVAPWAIVSEDKNERHKVEKPSFVERAKLPPRGILKKTAIASTRKTIEVDAIEEDDDEHDDGDAV